MRNGISKSPPVTESVANKEKDGIKMDLQKDNYNKEKGTNMKTIALASTMWFFGFVIGVYATFNNTPFDYFMFPILEYYGLV